MRRSALTTAVALALFVTGAVTPTPASADSKGHRSPADLVRIVKKSDPGTRTVGRVSASRGTVRAAGVEVAIASHGDVATVGDETVMGGNGVDYVSRAVDEGFQVAAVISDATQSVQTYRFKGKHLELTRAGFVIVRTGGPTGEPVAVIDPAWAVDAKGAKVASRFSVKGSRLTQTSYIDRTTAFPVVADPRVRTAWYGLSIDFTRSDTLALAAAGAGCERVASKSPPGVGRAIQLSCGFLAGWAGLATAQGKCVSAKLINMYVWVPWITKCYA